MKHLAKLSPAIAYLYLANSAFAQITIAPPGVGYDNLSTFINAAIRLAFIIGLIGVLVMLVWGAIEWIFSGGGKDQIDAARKRIINALIGLAILAVAFAIVVVAGQFVGINLLGTFTIPSPTNPTPPLPR